MLLKAETTLSYVRSFNMSVTDTVLKIISYNVDGLPLPKFMSSSGRDPRLATKFIARHLNDADADIIAVQEDFSYHEYLRDGISLKYKTLHSGTIPVGDGLNIFSKFPIYNVERVEWCEANGVFKDGSDELTPKGFLLVTLEVCKGVYLDVYDIHADANEAPDDVRVRILQFEQLLSYIEKHSKDRAVMVIGDTNTRIGWENSKLRELFVEKSGFRDCWTECCLGGKYQKDMINLDEYKPYEPDKWQEVFDSLDRVLLRNGKGITFTPLTHEYVDFGTDEEKKLCVELSDHSAAVVTVKLTVDSDALPAENGSFLTEKKSFAKTSKRRVKYISKALRLIISEIPSLFKGEKIEIK